MTTIPDAAIAVIAAAIDDYHLTTPHNQQTPHGAAERAVEYLASSGWALHIPRDNTTPLPRPRAACPHCCVHHLITQAGRIRRHGPHGHPCPGSGAVATPDAPTPTQPATSPQTAVQAPARAQPAAA